MLNKAMAVAAAQAYLSFPLSSSPSPPPSPSTAGRLPLASQVLRVRADASSSSSSSGAEGAAAWPRLDASRGLARDGPAQGGRWMSSTTRHVRIYMGYIDPVTLHMDQQQTDKLTLMLDPDNEFVWPEEKCQKVYAYFKELVDNYAGAPLTEYTLRLIGSDVEHYIRKLLLAGEIKYNLDCRVLNFSMGLPRLDPDQVSKDDQT